MAKFLSPENYIRQRARTLPIHECLINDEWKQNQLATVFVVRKHVNGHFTIGTYLVDLNCLGVKDTYFWYNISADEYEHLKEMLYSKQEMSVISYELAHNIVFAGENYATEIGFKSHPDFYKTTRFILVEDDYKIELIYIEVGEDGMPIYVQGPNDSPARVREIIETLNRTVGSDNYHYITLDDTVGELDYDDEIDDDSDDDSDDYDNDFDRYNDYSFEDLKNLLLNFETITASNIDEHSLIGIADNLIYRIEDGKKISNLFVQIGELLDFEVDVNEVHPSLFGLDSFDDKYDKKKLIADFVDTYNNISKNKSSKKKMAAFEKKYPDIPATAYIKAQYDFSKRESDNSLPIVQKYAINYPDYPLLQLLFSVDSILNSSPDDNDDFPEFCSKWFGDRKALNPIEANEYVFYLTLFIFKKENLAWGLAFLDALTQSDIPNEIIDYYVTIGTLTLVMLLQQRLLTEDFSHLK